MAHPLLINLSLSTVESASHDSSEECISWRGVIRLVEDEEPGVRAAALRALGLKIKLAVEDRNTVRNPRLLIVARACANHCQEEQKEAVRVSASWGLANCFDRFEPQ